jgi:hypothetical protein
MSRHPVTVRNIAEGTSSTPGAVAAVMEADGFTDRWRKYADLRWRGRLILLGHVLGMSGLAAQACLPPGAAAGWLPDWLPPAPSLSGFGLAVLAALPSCSLTVLTSCAVM